MCHKFPFLGNSQAVAGRDTAIMAGQTPLGISPRPLPSRPPQPPLPLPRCPFLPFALFPWGWVRAGAGLVGGPTGGTERCGTGWHYINRKMGPPSQICRGKGWRRMNAIESDLTILPPLTKHRLDHNTIFFQGLRCCIQYQRCVSLYKSRLSRAATCLKCSQFPVYTWFDWTATP